MVEYTHSSFPLFSRCTRFVIITNPQEYKLEQKLQVVSAQRNLGVKSGYRWQRLHCDSERQPWDQDITTPCIFFLRKETHESHNKNINSSGEGQNRGRRLRNTSYSV